MSPEQWEELTQYWFPSECGGLAKVDSFVAVDAVAVDSPQAQESAAQESDDDKKCWTELIEA
jgi:hypothetical protein